MHRGSCERPNFNSSTRAALAAREALAVAKLTDTQLQALADLADGSWKYGISIRGRHSLPSLRKRGFVAQFYGDASADQWQITREGRAAFCRLATIRHLRKPRATGDAS